MQHLLSIQRLLEHYITLYLTLMPYGVNYIWTTINPNLRHVPRELEGEIPLVPKVG